MIATHAPYAIIGDLVITYGKTTKTACGKRRLTNSLVSRDDATCIECHAAIELDRAELASMEALAREIGLT